MDTMKSIVSADYFVAALIGFLFFGLLAMWVGRYAFRGFHEDKKLAEEYSHELNREVVDWSILWTRQDLSMLNGQLNIVAGLLGAILVVLIVK